MRMLKDRYQGAQGYIDLYLHKEPALFIPWGSDHRHGRIVLPQDVAGELHVKNLITYSGSKLIAKRMRPGTSWGAGIGYLEVGTGVGTGTQANPQAEALTDTALKTPLMRKAITAWTYLDSGGIATAADTDTLELTTTYDYTEAIGNITECALWGGVATATIGTGHMFNYKTFAAWPKQNIYQLTIKWRLYF